MRTHVVILAVHPWRYDSVYDDKSYPHQEQHHRGSEDETIAHSEVNLGLDSEEGHTERD